MNRLNRQTILAGLLSTIVVAFAALGGVGAAKGSIGAAQHQNGKKITICHDGKNTITISVNAWPAHKKHGDTLGPCPQVKKNKGKRNGPQSHVLNPGPPTAGQPSATGNGNGYGTKK